MVQSWNYLSIEQIFIVLVYVWLQVVSVTMLHSGDAFNVIPDSATIGGTFRALKPESFVYLKERIQEVLL